MTGFKEIFETHYTWLEGFMRNVRRYSNRTAMIDPQTDSVWTYDALNRDANRFANAINADGFSKGDVIMAMLPNCPEFVFCYLAAHKTGGIFCPASFRLSAGELAYSIDDSKPFIFIYDKSFEKTVSQALSMSEWKPSRILVTGDGAPGSCSTYEEFVSSSSTSDPALPQGCTIFDETTRLYTSGTTGHPKGVPMTSINEVLSSHDVMIHFPMGYQDITMNTTPWFHRGGLHCAGPCPAFYAGAAIVIMRKFDAAATLDYTSRYGITFLIGVPTVLDALADEKENGNYDLPSLKGIVTMGSPLEREACIRYQKVLTPNIFNGYGTTETFWNTFLRPFNLPDGAGTAGASCIDDDVRVVKVYEDRRAEPDDLAACDGSEIGEVIISSPAKSPYIYFNNEEESDRKYYKGFLYTNDLASWDGQQFITIAGRKDDMIISSGENIYPTEIEAVLNTNEKVRDCIVTSVPDKVRGQKVVAYVISSDPSMTAADLDSYCKASPMLANFKRPRLYRFTDSIPYTATGKKRHVVMKEIALRDLESGCLLEP